MTKKFIATNGIGCVLVLASSIVFAQDQEIEVNQSKEPSLKMVMEVDGKKFEGEVGKPFSLSGNFEQAQAVVKTLEYRTFSQEGIEFNYPEKFHWDADTSEAEHKAWTMSGAESVISVLAVAEQYSAEEYADELKLEFDTEEFQQEEVKLKLGGQEYDAVRLVFEYDDYEYVYDILTFPSSKDIVRLVILQDLDPQRYQDSSEVKQTMRLLKQSFKVKDMQF